MRTRTRDTSNIQKAERPTRYAKGGRKGNMVTKPCPCIMKKGKTPIKSGERR